MSAGGLPWIIFHILPFAKKKRPFTLPQVINLRSLRPLDRDTIAASVRKTHRIISVEEGWPQSGVGSEIISVVVEDCFDDLDAPPERITGVDVPMPYSHNLEAAALPHIEDLVQVAKRMLGK